MAQDTATMAGKVTLSDIFLDTFTPEDGWNWCSQQEHWTAGASGTNSLAIMARCMTRRLGDSGCLGTWECIFPGSVRDARVLQVSVGNAGHRGVPVEAYLGPAPKVAQPELALELLKRLLLYPARLEGGGKGAHRRMRGQSA